MKVGISLEKVLTLASILPIATIIEILILINLGLRKDSIAGREFIFGYPYVLQLLDNRVIGAALNRLGGVQEVLVALFKANLGILVHAC